MSIEKMINIFKNNNIFLKNFIYIEFLCSMNITSFSLLIGPQNILFKIPTLPFSCCFRFRIVSHWYLLSLVSIEKIYCVWHTFAVLNCVFTLLWSLQAKRLVKNIRQQIKPKKNFKTFFLNAKKALSQMKLFCCCSVFVVVVFVECDSGKTAPAVSKIGVYNI